MNDLQLIKEIIVIAMVGYVFSSVLVQPRMVFSFWHNFLDSYVKPKSEKIADLFGLCVYCVTGQFALWYFLITKYWKVTVLDSTFLIITYVSIAIFLIAIFKKKWKM